MQTRIYLWREVPIISKDLYVEKKIYYREMAYVVIEVKIRICTQRTMLSGVLG